MSAHGSILHMSGRQINMIQMLLQMRFKILFTGPTAGTLVITTK